MISDSSYIRHLLLLSAATALANSLVFSKLYYCYSLYNGISFHKQNWTTYTAHSKYSGSCHFVPKIAVVTEPLMRSLLIATLRMKMGSCGYTRNAHFVPKIATLRMKMTKCGKGRSNFIQSNCVKCGDQYNLKYFCQFEHHMRNDKRSLLELICWCYVIRIFRFIIIIIIYSMRIIEKSL